MKPLSTDAERLTVEFARDRVKLSEICQRTPFGRDSTGELVGVAATFAKGEHIE